MRIRLTDLPPKRENDCAPDAEILNIWGYFLWMNLAELAGKNMSGQKCEIGIAKNKQTRNFICGVDEVAFV